MTSLFSFMRVSEPTPEPTPPDSPVRAVAIVPIVVTPAGDEVVAAPPPPVLPPPALPPPALPPPALLPPALPPPALPPPALPPPAPAMSLAPEDILAAMLTELRSFLAPAEAPLPASTVSLISVVERPVGLGGLRGIEPFGTFSAIALKGGRFDAVVSFQVWGEEPAAVEDAANALHGRLLAGRDALWTSGFLKIAAADSLQAEHIATLNFWRKAVHYRVLYEYRYQESDAESLIAQIPVTMEDSLLHDSTVITDDMVRWDNLATPALTVRLDNRRPFQLRELVILSFLPAGWDGAGVTISATVNGATVTQAFSSVRAFQASFALETGTIQLGPHPYNAGRRAFPNADFPEPIVLEGGDDTVHITYAAGAFDSDAVVYLRALP